MVALAAVQEPDDEFTSIWDNSDVFTRYAVELRCTDWLCGGVPKDPKVVEGWLRTKVTPKDEELKALMMRSLLEVHPGIPESATYEDVVAASRDLAGDRNTNGFKRDDDGLYLEGRCVKAMLKENTNVIYADKRWGPTKKGPKSYLAERVHVEEQRIYLGRREPDDVHVQFGKVSGPQGPRSTVTYYEVANQPLLQFTVLSMNDCIQPEQWRAILLSGEMNGLGAVRSQSFGRFVVRRFEHL